MEAGRRAVPFPGGAEARRSSLPKLRAVDGQRGRPAIELSGALEDGWSLRLLSRLAARRVGVLSGYARWFQGKLWIVRLEFDPTARSYDRQGFLELATESGPLPTLPDPRVIDFETTPSDAFGGALELRVDAWDRIGLLAGVLGLAHRSLLVPREILLETEAECAFHQITLVRADGRAPDYREASRLERSLHAVTGG